MLFVRIVMILEFWLMASCVSRIEPLWLANDSVRIGCEGRYQAAHGGSNILSCSIENHSRRPLRLAFDGLSLEQLGQAKALQSSVPIDFLPGFMIGLAASQQNSEGLAFTAMLSLGLMLADALQEGSSTRPLTMADYKVTLAAGESQRVGFLIPYPSSLMERRLTLCLQEPETICKTLVIAKAAEENRRRIHTQP